MTMTSIAAAKSLNISHKIVFYASRLIKYIVRDRVRVHAGDRRTFQKGDWHWES